jgi:gas vesicle protein
MADGYDRFDEGSGGGGFVMGLLTGTVLGAGLGMLFAPKAGTDLRNQLTEQAGTLANTATEGYRRASEQAGQWVDKGRDMYGKAYDKARDAVARGADEADRYVRESTGGMTGTAAPAGASSGTSATESSFGGGADALRGGAGSGSTYGNPTEPTRGASRPAGSASSGTSGTTGNSGTGPGGTRRS